MTTEENTNLRNLEKLIIIQNISQDIDFNSSNIIKRQEFDEFYKYIDSLIQDHESQIKID